MFEWDSNIECTQHYDHNSATYVWLRTALDECGPQWIRLQQVLLQLETSCICWLRTVLVECGSQWINVLGAVIWQQLLTADRSGFWQALTESWSSCSDRDSYGNWLRTALDECDPQSKTDILLGAIWTVHCWLRPAVVDCDPQWKAAENSFWFFI